MSAPVLNSITATVSFDNEEPLNISLECPNTELENIRLLQERVNEIISGKISQLKTENKLTEVPTAFEEESEADSDSYE